MSGRLLVLLLQLPTEAHDRNLLRSNVPALMLLAQSFPTLTAAACCERLIRFPSFSLFFFSLVILTLFRLCPPYDVTQLAFYLQLVRLDAVSPELPEAPELVCYAMGALEAARRAAPSLWFRGAGKEHSLYDFVSSFLTLIQALLPRSSSERWSC